MQAISLWLAAAIVILTGWAIVKKYLKSKRTQRNTQPPSKILCAPLLSNGSGSS